jgi:hypothetical protein
MINSIGDIGAALTESEPYSLTAFYGAMRLSRVYDPSLHTSRTRPFSHMDGRMVRVSDGTCPLTTRFARDTAS